MRWFKHFSDNYRGRSIDTLFEQMGHTGVACYFIMMEIFTEKMEIYDSKNMKKSDFILSFPLGFVRRNLRISQGKLEVFLRFSQGLGLFSYEIIGKELRIEMPILLDLLHSDVVKSRSRREQYKNGSGPDKDKDKEIDIDKEVEERKEKKLPARQKNDENEKAENKKIKDAYFNAYRLRYGVEPVSNAAFNSQISNLRKKLGVDDSVGVVEFYLKHNDSFYLKNTHSFGLCLLNAETLRTQMLRGKPITSLDVRNFEKTQNAIQINESIKNGENF